MKKKSQGSSMEGWWVTQIPKELLGCGEFLSLPLNQLYE